MTCFTQCFFFFNDTATTEIYTLSLHDALPIYAARQPPRDVAQQPPAPRARAAVRAGAHVDRPAQPAAGGRSEEHTSELQSRQYLVCRLLLEKKKQTTTRSTTYTGHTCYTFLQA